MRPFRRPTRPRRAKPLCFTSAALRAKAEREFAALLAPPLVRAEAAQVLPAPIQTATAENPPAP
ncbi:hypothetical protein [Paracraurococcus lichenis]|uniref:Uncharacterized protein n=1 Tax=Paracraurococcus lichenis TaxID=3064888 RepID=A0ABT9E831_9PROT|nr:hypothetical protein [Paracraurococcus sp. LOR1-02]MDO9712363.1 hypothetical protein [Paracraurococcus sp. LOR1-02]